MDATDETATRTFTDEKKIRNPKLEIRNKFKIQMTKARKTNHRNGESGFRDQGIGVRKKQGRAEELRKR